MVQLPEQPSLVFAPNRAGYDKTDKTDERHYQDFLSCRADGGVERWSCQKSPTVGDVYLFWFGSPVSCIGGIGVVNRKLKPQDNDGKFDWTRARKVYFCNFRPVTFFSPGQAVTIDDIHRDRILAKWWAGKRYRGKPKKIYDAKVAARFIATIKEKCDDSRKLQSVLRHVPTWLRS